MKISLRRRHQSCRQIEIYPEFRSFLGAFLGTYDKNGNFLFLWLEAPFLTLGRDGQSCRRLQNFGRSPEFGSFQKITQNFFASFKIGQQLPQKLPNATETLKKLPKVAQNFYIFVKSTQKKLPKSSCRRRPFTAEAPPIGKIHPFSKITGTLEPVMRFRCPLRFRIS